MDGFDKKRQMVKTLMDMLKHNASDEVSHGLPHTTLPEGHPSAKINETPDLVKHNPSVAEHPHMVDLTPTNAIQQKTSDSSKLAEGGLAGTDMSEHDEAERLTEPKPQNADGSADEEALSNLPSHPEDEDMEKEEAQALHNENIEYEDQDNNSSSFDAFLPRKKKKY